MTKEKPTSPPLPAANDTSPPHAPAKDGQANITTPTEIGGRKGPEPTRYGDWENGGKCVDF